LDVAISIIHMFQWTIYYVSSTESRCFTTWTWCCKSYFRFVARGHCCYVYASVWNF
jgi:hypothetical protein